MMLSKQLSLLQIADLPCQNPISRSPELLDRRTETATSRLKKLIRTITHSQHTIYYLTDLIPSSNVAKKIFHFYPIAVYSGDIYFHNSLLNHSLQLKKFFIPDHSVKSFIAIKEGKPVNNWTVDTA
ncbi:MAG: hypothetical protein LBE12_02340 [Planctomycetaceae bacterium]|jgi:hypothetical protein|nr:hypothetical protein [Planctomycetaceae bacterium]